MNIRFVSSVLAGTLLLASTVFAQDTAPEANNASPTRHAHVNFEQADSNHDGKLSREEAAAMPFVARHFDQIDSNHDGYVTHDELRQAWRARRAARAAKAQGQGSPSSSQSDAAEPGSTPGS